MLKIETHQTSFSSSWSFQSSTTINLWNDPWFKGSMSTTVEIDIFQVQSETTHGADINFLIKKYQYQSTVSLLMAIHLCKSIGIADTWEYRYCQYFSGQVSISPILFVSIVNNPGDILQSQVTAMLGKQIQLKHISHLTAQCVMLFRNTFLKNISRQIYQCKHYDIPLFCQYSFNYSVTILFKHEVYLPLAVYFDAREIDFFILFKKHKNVSMESCAFNREWLNVLHKGFTFRDVIPRNVPAEIRKTDHHHHHLFENVPFFHATLGLDFCPYEVPPHIPEYRPFRM